LTFVALFAVWLVLYFGRPTLGPLLDLLPLHRSLLVHRFIGGVHLAAIPLVGIGAAWLWSLLERRPLARTTALAVLAIVLLIPAMRERWTYYTFNNEWLGDTRAALAADTDARDLIARVRELGGGRVYAGMRNNWGESLGFGLPFRGVKLYNLFAFERATARGSRTTRRRGRTSATTTPRAPPARSRRRRHRARAASSPTCARSPRASTSSRAARPRRRSRSRSRITRTGSCASTARRPRP